MKKFNNLGTLIVVLIFFITSIAFTLALDSSQTGSRTGPPSVEELNKIRADAMAQAELEKDAAMKTAQEQQAAGQNQQIAGQTQGAIASTNGAIQGEKAASDGKASGAQEAANAEAEGKVQGANGGSAPTAEQIAKMIAEGEAKGRALQAAGEAQGKDAAAKGAQEAANAESKGKQQAETAQALGDAKRKEMEAYALQKEQEWTQLMFTAKKFQMDELLRQRENQTELSKDIKIDVTAEKLVINNAEFVSSDKEVQLTVNGQDVQVAQKDGRVIISDNNINVDTSGMTIENNKILLNNLEIKMPHEVVSKIDANTQTMELVSKDSKPVYVIKDTSDAKLLGFIPVKTTMTINIDAVTGAQQNVKNSWWAFLATSEHKGT